MARECPYSWKEALVTVALIAAGLVAILHPRSPAWLRLLFVFVAIVGPYLPYLALIPWHFVALHRGLARRSRDPCAVWLLEGTLHVERGDRRTTHALASVARARFAQNDNWTESKMLEDALGLFSEGGREMERLPASAAGFESLLGELRARGIPIEHVDVAAPAVLD